MPWAMFILSLRKGTNGIFLFNKQKKEKKKLVIEGTLLRILQ
jgi:hypothetical protein